MGTSLSPCYDRQGRPPVLWNIMNILSAINPISTSFLLRTEHFETPNNHEGMIAESDWIYENEIAVAFFYAGIMINFPLKSP